MGVGGAKARKLFARGGKLIYDEVGTHSPPDWDGKAGPKKEKEEGETREASGGGRSGDGVGGGKAILEGKGKGGSRGNDMEKPGKAVTTGDLHGQGGKRPCKQAKRAMPESG